MSRAHTLFETEKLEAWAGEKPLIRGVSFSLLRGETVVITGENGAGKSTIGRAIMGDKRLTIAADTMMLDGESILELEAAARARKGLFYAPQEIPTIDGVSYREMLRAALEVRGKKMRGMEFKQSLAECLAKVGVGPFMAEREIGSKLSGGEKKKMEVVELLMLRPKVAILDEIDSGLDKKSTERIAQILEEAQKEWGLGLIIITHNQKITEKLRIGDNIRIEKGQMRREYSE